MKIQSGRIQQAGINPNNGLSLGFVGMGQTNQAAFDSLIPGSTPVGAMSIPADAVTSQTVTDASDFDNTVNAWYASAASLIPSPTTTSNTLLYAAMAAGAVFLVLALSKKR